MHVDITSGTMIKMIDLEMSISYENHGL